MATQQEMERAGIRREIKMIALDHAAGMISKLGVAAAHDEDERLLALCAAFVTGANEIIEELNAENLAAFQVFMEAGAEVDALEAMLAVGGEEIAGES